jgi:putative ABC transport system permease protein
MLFYRALLRLYPKSFRAEYGAEMIKDVTREWHAAPAAAKAALLARITADTLANAMRVHGDITRQDLRYAMRSLRRTPGFTITAILVAALGIGATTATFSVADHVLLRPLPFPEADRVVRLWEDHSSLGYPRMEPSPPNFLDWQRMATVFERLEPFTGGSASLVGHGEPEQVIGASVGGGVFQILGRSAALGRVLTESDVHAAEGERPIVISDRIWRTRFGASPGVLGQTISLDDRAYVIVGVMPPDFYFPSRNRDFWRTLRLGTTESDGDRGNHYLAVIGRLKDGVSIEDARAEMDVIAARLAQAYPKAQAGKGVTLSPWREQITGQPRVLLLGLVGASICVLLIACTNLANLLMSRALARRSEFAVRAAIGASVDRLVRQMLTDSFVLAACGGVLGIVLAVVAAPLLVRLVPTSLPIAEVPPTDLRMLAGTLLLTIGAGMAFGLLPALRVCRKIDGSALKDGARGGTSRGTERLRSSLVVAEIVASVVLIVTVGLLTQALLNVQRVDPGFKTDDVLTVRTTLPRIKYAKAAEREQFYQRVLTDVKALPGVQSAAYISFLPMVMGGGVWPVLSTAPDPGSPQKFVSPDPKNERRASLRFVTPGFFSTMRTPVRRGRDVSADDTRQTTPVAVVSESLVRQFFPDRDPIGQQFAFAYQVRTIVGVVGDIRVRGLEADTSEPQVYLPAGQFIDGDPLFYAPQDLAIRAAVPVTTLVPAVRAIIATADPLLPIVNVRTLEEIVSLETASRVVQLRVLGAFAVAAFLLAAIGIHGLLAFTVSARSREIGVRIALGAKARDIVTMVIGRSAVLAALGVVIGAAFAYAAGRSMQALLFGVDPANPVVFAAAITLALLMTLAGSLLPAWRAVRVDPLAATRAD